MKTSISKCASYSIESILQDKCISCENNYGYYPIYNNTNDTFIDCYSSPEGYYLDNNVFKPCYPTCKTCAINGNDINHNCIECLDEYIYENINNNYKNCYKPIPTTYITPKIITTNIIIENNNCEKNKGKIINGEKKCIENCYEEEIYKYEFNNTCFEQCPNNTKESNKNKYICELSCPKESPFVNIETQKCVENCNINDMFNNICKINYKEENKTKKEDLGKKIVEDILNGNLGDLISEVLNNKTDIIINEDYAIHQITGLNSQPKDSNLSTIDFKECENLLRGKYPIIKDEEELIIYKIEHKIEGFNIPIIEYVLFTQDGSINLNKFKFKYLR